MTNLDFVPSLGLQVQTVQVIDVLVVATTKDVELVLVNSCCMSPSCAWNSILLWSLSFTEIKSSAIYCLDSSVALDKVTKVKHVHIIEMHILTVAATKADDFRRAKSTDSMEPLALKGI